MRNWRKVPTVVCLAKQKLSCKGVLDIVFESWNRAKAWGHATDEELEPDTAMVTIFADNNDVAAFEFEKFSESEARRGIVWLRQIARTFNRAADKLEKL